ncbi:MAG: PAS domain-containing protein, partial [Candidatus Hodarchaeota archaeon]
MSNLNSNDEDLPNSLFREFYKTSSEGQFILNDKGLLVDVNPRFCSFLGYHKEELLNKEITFLLPKSVQVEFNEILSNPGWTGNSIFMGNLLNSDGTISVVEFSITAATVNDRKYLLVTIKDITVEKQYEYEANEFEQIMMGLSENSLVAIMLVEDGVLEYATDSVSIISGYSKEELKNFKLEDFGEIIHPDDVNMVMNQYKRRLSNPDHHKTLDFEFRIVDKEGTVKWINTFLQEMPSKEEITVDLAICYDITKRKESEMKFKVIAENSQFSVIIVGQDDNIKYLNKATTELTGYSMEEILFSDNQGYLGFIHPEDRDYVFEQERKRSDDEIEFSKPYTFRIVTKSGLEWMEKYASRIHFQGKPANLVTLVDYTPRRESEDLLRILSEQSLMGVGIIQDDKFRYINDKLAQTYGFTTAEVKSWGPGEFLKQVHPDDRQHILEQYKKKQAGDLEGIIPSYEVRIITKDGKIKWMTQFSDTVIYHGRPADLTISIDITDRKEAEQNLKESEEKFRLISEQSMLGIVVLQDDVIKY